MKSGNTDISDRQAVIDLHHDEFRRLGHIIVDRIADFYAGLSQRPVTGNKSPSELRNLLGSDRLPEEGSPPSKWLEDVVDLLFENSLYNGHPKFWGYITSSAAPVGTLAEMLATAVNPNTGAFILSPLATELEAQTVRWIAELIGFPTNCGGLLVSGGNMANFGCFLAARKAKAEWDIKNDGHSASENRLVVYVSKETHTWIDKAAELFGLGSKSIHWIETDKLQRMNTEILVQQIGIDKANGLQPFMVVGTAGTVSTGAIDPLPKIAAICREFGLWFHVDGAYGAPAAALPDASDDLKGLQEADSIAVDPHKWLYSPLEAGCVLVRDGRHLEEAFSHHPSYYNFEGSGEEKPINYHNFGLQNSRGFRALKVWMGLRQAGRQGYIRMISDDIQLSKTMAEAIRSHNDLELVTQSLSISTFRYVPSVLPEDRTAAGEYLNRINEELLNRLQQSGEAFVSNALLDGRYLLRACIVNFRTGLKDVKALPEIVIRFGKQIDREMQTKNESQ